MSAAENKQLMQNIFSELSKGDGKLQELTEYLDTELVTTALGT